MRIESIIVNITLVEMVNARTKMTHSNVHVREVILDSIARQRLTPVNQIPVSMERASTKRSHLSATVLLVLQERFAIVKKTTVILILVDMGIVPVYQGAHRVPVIEVIQVNFVQ